MAKDRTAGVVAVRRDASGELFILFVLLRWSRSGFKSLMHRLNGSDPASSRVAEVMDCTDEELTFFTEQGVDGLWSSPLAGPGSYCSPRGPFIECHQLTRN